MIPRENNYGLQRHYSISQTSQVLGFSRRTVLRWIKKGNLKAIKINGRWRIPERELTRLMGST